MLTHGLYHNRRNRRALTGVVTNPFGVRPLALEAFEREQRECLPDKTSLQNIVPTAEGFIK